MEFGQRGGGFFKEEEKEEAVLGVSTSLRPYERQNILAGMTYGSCNLSSSALEIAAN